MDIIFSSCHEVPKYNPAFDDVVIQLLPWESLYSSTIWPTHQLFLLVPPGNLRYYPNVTDHSWYDVWDMKNIFVVKTHKSYYVCHSTKVEMPIYKRLSDPFLDFKWSYILRTQFAFLSKYEYTFTRIYLKEYHIRNLKMQFLSLMVSITLLPILCHFQYVPDQLYLVRILLKDKRTFYSSIGDAWPVIWRSTHSIIQSLKGCHTILYGNYCYR